MQDTSKGKQMFPWQPGCGISAAQHQTEPAAGGLGRAAERGESGIAGDPPFLVGGSQLR